MLTLYHLNNSRSQRILWLLEEIGTVPYEINKYERQADQLAPPELKKIHPLGLAPVLKDTDGDVTLAESGAIIEYIIAKYAPTKFQPPESGRIHDLYFKHYVEGALMPIVVIDLLCNMVPQQAPFIIRPLIRSAFNMLRATIVTPRLKENAAMLEEHLTKDNKEWCAGGSEPTISDFMLSYALEFWSHLEPEMLGPKTKTYIQRIHDRPAFQMGLKKGGEYAYAKYIPAGEN